MNIKILSGILDRHHLDAGFNIVEEADGNIYLMRKGRRLAGFPTTVSLQKLRQVADRFLEIEAKQIQK